MLIVRKLTQQTFSRLFHSSTSWVWPCFCWMTVSDKNSIKK